MSPEEQVLVVKRDVIERVGMFQGLTFDVDRYLESLFAPATAFFLPRPAAEMDPTHKQLIPYVLMEHEGKVLSYVRGKRSGESRLVAKRSIGIGGHINPVDDMPLFGDMREAYLNAVHREVAEEVSVDTEYTERVVALINDDATEVGSVHLGVVHHWQLKEPKVTRREQMITQMDFLSLEDLQAERENMETWSQRCAWITWRLRRLATMANEEFINLWPGQAPEAKAGGPEDVPAIQAFVPAPEVASGAGMIVCAGGAYGRRAEYEGPAVGQWLAANGIAGFVLRYRLGPAYHHPAQMMDGQRAMRYVRLHAQRWQLAPQRIGILGFSAGGHLASTVSTHFTAGDPDSPDLVERVSSRPDVQVLLYPVITMSDHTHAGSRQNLLGDRPDGDLIELLSNEKHVTPQTPPTFLYHSTEDTAVPAINSDMYAAALERAGVECLYIRGPYGGHGGSLRDTWCPACLAWLGKQGFGGARST